MLQEAQHGVGEGVALLGRADEAVDAIADELAGAAELVQGKLERVPVAVVRGAAYEAAEGSARMIVRAAERDLFR